MKDKHCKIQVDNTFTTDKNTKIQIYFDQVFYMYLWMDMILQIYMRITIIVCIILSIYKTPLFTHFTVKNFWTKQFPFSNKSIMQIFTIKLQYKYPQFYIHLFLTWQMIFWIVSIAMLYHLKFMTWKQFPKCIF